jgi:hypothetical protein
VEDSETKFQSQNSKEMSEVVRNICCSGDNIKMGV